MGPTKQKDLRVKVGEGPDHTAFSHAFLPKGSGSIPSPAPAPSPGHQCALQPGT